jgi:uncharacterized protein (TIGR02996 family)
MDEHAFWNAIRAAPYDAAPKLVYADWLDERGQTERAAAIRDHVAGRSEAEERKLVDAICADIDANGPRLAFVDWLDARTDFTRADEVRRSIAWVARGRERLPPLGLS